jgi:endonuclease-8
MPEGPENRKYAEKIAAILEGEKLLDFRGSTKDAKIWLQDHPDAIKGQKVLSVRSHGKNIIIQLSNGYFLYSHLMMFGHWLFPDKPPQDVDPREKALFVTKKGVALLYSAPVFHIGQGDPYQEVPSLHKLGPDVLPYEGKFDSKEFTKRLLTPANAKRAIGAALMDQSIAAGIGNYLRAEILFDCKINPFKRVDELSEDELECLRITIPAMAARAYRDGGKSARKSRKAQDQSPGKTKAPGMTYQVYRRTGQPCVACGTKILEAEMEKRTVYFCPKCQRVKRD